MTRRRPWWHPIHAVSAAAIGVLIVMALDPRPHLWPYIVSGVTLLAAFAFAIWADRTHENDMRIVDVLRGDYAQLTHAFREQAKSFASERDYLHGIIAALRARLETANMGLSSTDLIGFPASRVEHLRGLVYAQMDAGQLGVLAARANIGEGELREFATGGKLADAHLFTLEMMIS